MLDFHLPKLELQIFQAVLRFAGRVVSFHRVGTGEKVAESEAVFLVKMQEAQDYRDFGLSSRLVSLILPSAGVPFLKGCKPNQYYAKIAPDGVEYDIKIEGGSAVKQYGQSGVLSVINLSQRNQ